MATPRFAIIFNPFARGEKAGRLEDEIRQMAPADSLFLATQERGDARRLARQAALEGVPTVVAAGGDGTVNEVVNGLMLAREQSHTAAPALGILPAGTVNVFALELGLPLNIRKAWDVIEAGTVQSVDLGRANDHFFVQMAGVGLDAQVVRDTDPNTRKVLGPISYLFTAAGVLGKTPPTLVVEVPGQVPILGAFVLVGNGRYYGGPFEIFKGAKLDNGLLEVLVMQNLSYQDAFRYLQSAIFGTHDQLDDVQALSVTECTIRSADAGDAGDADVHNDPDALPTQFAPEAPVSCADPESVPTEADGEVVGCTPVRFRVYPMALQVCVPVESSRQ